MPDADSSAPRPGAWHIAKRVARETLADDVLSLTAGLAFFLLVSLFPLALTFLTILGLLPIPDLAPELFELLRPFWELRRQAIALTLGLAVMMILALVLLAFGPQLGERLAASVGLGSAFETAWNIVRWPLILAGVSLGAAVLYYFGPDVEQDVEWITAGSVIATLLGVGASAALTWYVSSAGKFNETYGAPGAVMVLMPRLYVSGVCFLMGGEVTP